MWAIRRRSSPARSPTICCSGCGIARSGRASWRAPAAEKFKRDMLEAERSGNLPFDSEADWIDYASAGLSGPEEVVPAAVRALTTVRLDRDVYHMGLRGTIDPEAQPEVAAAVLEARRAMRARLEDPSLGRLVEVFDPERYNSNATLAENLLFGAPVDETFDIDHLAAHPYVQQILDRAGPDRHAGRGRVQAGRDHGRAVRRPAARPRVLPAVQLHQRRRSAGLSGADHARRPEPARHARSGGPRSV